MSEHEIAAFGKLAIIEAGILCITWSSGLLLKSATFQPSCLLGTALSIGSGNITA
ncbi:MAG: hypothetical protein JOY67_21620 [Hyphomicrobiales bacterium]|nr:hypothetical protein [Hyphomicrobiales bacterium]MBV9115419.1 hypothetical protein [Hyphomicrobiales bacterium]MBV9519533.1 hypothetical protein [Hyphomicrobiales bacterium]